MIVITGALGFIGSCLVKKLNDEGHTDLMVVDDFYKDYKEYNLDKKQIQEWIHRDIFLDLFGKMHKRIDFVFHLGARTDTTLADKAVFKKLNLDYSKAVWEICTRHNIPLVYASSAATYGDGEHGYEDSHEIVDQLKPLNPYGESKNDFDKWVLKQDKQPPFWAGVKFFNVYGPNEYHKNRMASVIFHTVNQIKATGEMKLFKSHQKGIANGHQKRDFVYVKDVVDVLYFLFKKQKGSGLYNLGTGEARTFLDLATLTFGAMNKEPKISFIDTPVDIRKNYQYFTEADISKLRALGYKKQFHSLEEGVGDYVTNYLLAKKVW
ncbi:MAG: ADP-L-glycero-D-manno-heptose 6-epimerase [Saprospiraceae bacterium]|jgi:ADP-L-glycero-D-manno-heptose 6-epimerase